MLVEYGIAAGGSAGGGSMESHATNFLDAFSSDPTLYSIVAIAAAAAVYLVTR